MEVRPAEHAFRSSLAAVAAASGAVTATDKELLREVVCAEVDDLKSMGWTVEQVIIRIKDVAAEAGFGAHTLRGRPTDSILEEVVKWCIERYYDGAQGVP